MSDPTFAQFYPQSAAFEPQAYHKLDTAAPPTIALDSAENQKQSFDFFNYSQSGLDVVAPHPDQFELELDNSLAAFDAELSILPIDTADFSFYRSATPTFGPPSTFTVSSESVSGYDSAYNDNLSSRSESFYNFNAQSPTSNYTSSVYSLTQEQLDMEFQRMAMPTHDDPNSFGALPTSPSIRSSPGSVPNISQYSPPYSSPRGSFSDYEPAQPQQVRIGSSAASEYYPQTHVPIHKYATNARLAHRPVSSPSVSPQMSHMPSSSTISVGTGGTLLRSAVGTVEPSGPLRVLVVEDNSILRNLLWVFPVVLICPQIADLSVFVPHSVKWLRNMVRLCVNLMGAGVLIHLPRRAMIIGRPWTVWRGSRLSRLAVILSASIFSLSRTCRADSECPCCSVVLLDLSMPILDGVGATARMREIESKRMKEDNASGSQPTRILALTGMSSLEDKCRAFEAGVDG